MTARATVAGHPTEGVTTMAQPNDTPRPTGPEDERGDDWVDRDDLDDDDDEEVDFSREQE